MLLREWCLGMPRTCSGLPSGAVPTNSCSCAAISTAYTAPHLEPGPTPHPAPQQASKCHVGRSVESILSSLTSATHYFGISVHDCNGTNMAAPLILPTESVVLSIRFDFVRKYLVNDNENKELLWKIDMPRTC